MPLCSLGLKQDPDLQQGFLEIFAAVGEVPQKPPGDTVSQSRLLEELFGEGELRDVVGGRQLVGDRDPVGSAQQVELGSVPGLAELVERHR